MTITNNCTKPKAEFKQSKRNRFQIKRRGGERVIQTSKTPLEKVGIIGGTYEEFLENTDDDERLNFMARMVSAAIVELDKGGYHPTSILIQQLRWVERHLDEMRWGSKYKLTDR